MMFDGFFVITLVAISQGEHALSERKVGIQLQRPVAGTKSVVVPTKWSRPRC